jgi:hypothetical protein
MRDMDELDGVLAKNRSGVIDVVVTDATHFGMRLSTKNVKITRKIPTMCKPAPVAR